jgi:chromosome segregation ATPase
LAYGLICCPGNDTEPKARPTESQGGLEEQAIIAVLRQDLREAERRADLWKEQAQEARTEYIECRSDANVLQIGLESTEKELSRVREDHRRLEELVRDLRVEIGELGQLSVYISG